MKSILDQRFKYRPSFDTDIRKTFERIRRQRLQKETPKAKSSSAPVEYPPIIIRLVKKD